MNEALVPLVQYLTYKEAVELYHELLALEVVALVKSCGPPSLPYGAGIYYQLLIQPEDLPRAQPILADFSQKQVKNDIIVPTCPRCGSTQVHHKPNLSWWRKIIYAGTTVWECQTCRRTFFT